MSRFKDRKVTLSYYKELYNFRLEGEGKSKKNRHISLFSLSQQEAEDILDLLSHKLRIYRHKRTDLDENSH